MPTFLDHVSGHLKWDVLAIQEGFKKQEGLESKGHVVFTAPERSGNLFCPAVIINKRWATSARYAAGGARWVAATVNKDILAVSAHLPYATKRFKAFNDVLLEIEAFLETRKEKFWIIGADLSVKLSGQSDFERIGPSVPNADMTDKGWKRSCRIVEFVTDFDLTVTNSWANTEHE